jgi:ribonuclease E
MLESDSTTTTDTTTRAAGKTRVHELAKELGVTSKQVLAALAELGEPAKSASASLAADLADRVRTALAAPAPAEAPAQDAPAEAAPAASRAKAAPAKAARTRNAAKAAAGPPTDATEGQADGPTVAADAEPAPSTSRRRTRSAPPVVVFAAPPEAAAPVARRPRKAAAPTLYDPEPAEVDITVAEDAEDQTAEPEDVREAAVEQASGARRRRRRGRRGRGGAARPGGANGAEDDDEDDDDEAQPDTASEAAEDPDDGESGADDDETEDGADEGGESASTRRRRRRRRSGNGPASETGEDDPADTVVHVRPPREPAQRGGGDRSGGGRGEGDDGVRGVKGSTRLEAKRQRRRDGRDTGRRRPPILSEAEFLARREAVDRVMAVRQTGDRTQIAVLEDNVLVEHYVTRASSAAYVGNIYLGRVQNVLPSMEAAFVDIGKGRNGVLYAGEVNWDAAGLEGKSRSIENALKSGDAVLVQVSKDPIGHKGARLTSQISLPGRFLVYVPGGGMTGISRKLPDTERHRLKTILKKIVPEDAGVIVRTAAEGASEEELTRDVERLKAQWESVSAKAADTKSAPTLVHGEPDLAIRVVRDVFNEDFRTLTVQGDDAWQTVSEYISGIAPDLAERVSKHTGTGDLFHDLRVDEQLMKALDRKVYLPSGGSLVIDRTEAMTVIDVNTGKFIGSGGNLEQTVTRNNLEAAEEIVRQLRLRDIGGMVVVDFIDMVLESNRDLVLRRLTECLGRDRTKHQVAEVTSLGLVQMTRKRIGEGLLEAFSETCETCRGRGVILHSEPVDRGPSGSTDASDDTQPKARRRRGGSGAVAAAKRDEAEATAGMTEEQRKAALAAMAAVHRAAHPDDEPGSDEEIAKRPGFGASPDVSDHDAAAELEMEAVASVIESATTDPEPLPVEAQSRDRAEAAPGAETEEPFIDPATAVGDEAEADDAPAQAEPGAAIGASNGPPRRRRRAATRPAGPPQGVQVGSSAGE